MSCNIFLKNLFFQIEIEQGLSSFVLMNPLLYSHLKHHIVVINFNPLGDPGDGEELLVLVKLDAGHDGAVVEHVRGVGQGGQGTDTVIP